LTLTFRKPGTKREGLKVLVWGKPGSGKTIFALSFPKVVAIDSEDGMGWYEGEERGRNLYQIANTQNFYELQETLSALKGMDGFETLVIDSETKFKENLQQTYIEVEEKRAKRKGKDVEDVNLSIRSWGKIGNVQTDLQNLKIDLASTGRNVVSVAQLTEVKEQIGDKSVVVGKRPDMKKKAEHDYDVVIELFTQGDGDDIQYKGRIYKDRTEVTKEGQVINNPSYDIWKDRAEKTKEFDAKDIDYSTENHAAKERLEKELEDDELTNVEKLKAFIKTASDTDKKAIGVELKNAGIEKFTGLRAAQQKQIGEILAKYQG